MLETIKYKIAICDDDDYDINIISKIVSEYQYRKNIDFEIDLYKSADNLLSEYIPGQYMFLFLDVEMEKMDGIELAQKIRALPDMDVFIIYVSSHPQYMSGAFDVRAFNYIQKTMYTKEELDLMQKKLFCVLDNAFENLEQSQKIIQIKTSYEESAIFKIKEIVAISSQNKKDTSLIIRYAGKDIICQDRVKNIYDILAKHNFVYVNRWCIVNLLHIHVIGKTKIVMDDGTKYDISRHYRAELNKLFSENVLSLY